MKLQFYGLNRLSLLSLAYQIPVQNNVKTRFNDGKQGKHSGMKGKRASKESGLQPKKSAEQAGKELKKD